MKEADSEIYSNEQNDPFMYMPVKWGETNIAALIDTGSSINILSIDLFNSLSENCKSRICIYSFQEEIKLANGHHIKIIGTADLKIRTDKMHTIKTSITQNVVSHDFRNELFEVEAHFNYIYGLSLWE